jgi:hypothetical protein
VQYRARVRDSEGKVVRTPDGDKCYFPPEHRLVPHWFSDGGITANFPVHFFDALLPPWPTFGLNLTGYPEGFEDEHVWLPDQGRGGHNMVWERITSMQGFLGRILGTFHGWRDTLQTTMPGYRGRIAHVRRLSTEGGVNLTMPPEVVAGMALRGCLAGRRLRVRFTEGADSRYPRETDRHRWLRFRIALSEVQQLLAHVDAERDIYQPWCNKEHFEAFDSAYIARPEEAEEEVPEEEIPRWPFPHLEEGHEKAGASLAHLCTAFRHIKEGGFDFADGAPWPDPQLRQLPPE